jgi:isoleucyl-tRNA synthetase
LLDRYVLAKTRDLVEQVQDGLDTYDIAGACASVSAFIDALNNWYIRRSRDRFWGTEGGVDASAFDTLYTVLVTLTKVAAPLLPLLSEEIYRGLTGCGDDDSVHLCDWPSADVLPADPDLVRDMDRVREVCSVGLSLRVDSGMRVRQPLALLTVSGRDTARLASFADLIEDEVNVKAVAWSDDLEAFGRFVLKPNGAVVGPKLGGDTQKVMKAAREGDWQSNDDGTVTVAGITLEPDDFDLALHPIEGHATAALSGNDAVVNLDVELTDELVAEGLARDLVRLVQQARKDQDLVVTDRIELRLALPTEVADQVRPWLDFVASQVLATSVEEVGAAGLPHTGTLAGQQVAFGITVAA